MRSYCFIGGLLLLHLFLLFPVSADAQENTRSSPSGQWNKVESVDVENMSEEEREKLENLQGIAYLGGYKKASDKMGVVRYDAEQAYNSLSLLVSGHAPEASLIDMNGKQVHRWKARFNPKWNPEPDHPNKLRLTFWRRVHLFPNGDILAIFNGVSMIKLDKRSNVLWDFPRCHHDMDVAEDGTIYVLTQVSHIIPRLSEDIPVMDDAITLLTPEGKEIKTVSLIDCVEKSDVLKMPNVPKSGDIFHANTIEILDGSHEARHPAFKKGNVLVSLLSMHTIAVVDLELERVVWAAKGDWRSQHQPTFLPNGDIMIFDNRGANGMSKVIEIEPVSGDTVWTCSEIDGQPFYSRTSSSCQRLPNGNTLVTVTEPGFAFEVTPDKEVVWEYVSPYRAGKEKDLVASLFEIVRLDKNFPTDWMK